MSDLDEELSKIDCFFTEHERLCDIRRAQILTPRDYVMAYLLTLLATAIYSKLNRPPSSQLLLDDCVILTAIVIVAEFMQKFNP